MTTPRQILEQVRTITNDADTSPENQRQSNAELLRHLSELVALTMALRPEFFNRTITHTCAAGAFQQIAGGQKFIEALRIRDGRALTWFDKDSLDAFDPNWMRGDYLIDENAEAVLDSDEDLITS